MANNPVWPEDVMLTKSLKVSSSDSAVNNFIDTKKNFTDSAVQCIHVPNFMAEVFPRQIGFCRRWARKAN